MERDCSELSYSSSEIYNSIVWIGRKHKGFTSPASIKTNRNKKSELIKTANHTVKTIDNRRTIEVSIEASDIMETTNIAGRTEIPETSESIGKLLCCESLTSSECDSDDSSDSYDNIDYSDATKIGKASLSLPSAMPVDPEDMWKTFTDDEYESGTLNIEVPTKSIFNYLEFKEKPIYLFNVPEKSI